MWPCWSVGRVCCLRSVRLRLVCVVRRGRCFSRCCCWCVGFVVGWWPRVGPVAGSLGRSLVGRCAVRVGSGCVFVWSVACSVWGGVVAVCGWVWLMVVCGGRGALGVARDGLSRRWVVACGGQLARVAVAVGWGVVPWAAGWVVAVVPCARSFWLASALA